MMPTETVTFTTPDKVERVLRFTLGARKRIAEMFKEPNIQTVLNQFGDGALPDLAYCMMFDAAGDPPKGLDVKRFAEELDDATPLLAAIMSAVSKGAAPKNELEALLRKAQEMEAEKLIGSILGRSPFSASESQQPSSGGVPTENSTPSVPDTESSSDSPSIAPV
jgi:hypothetical protein